MNQECNKIHVEKKRSLDALFGSTPMRYHIRDITLISLGLMGAGLGTTLMLKAGIGTNALGTTSDGLSKLMSISAGQANILLNCLFMIPTVIFARKNIGIGTVLCVFTIGLYMDLFDAILPVIPMEVSLLLRIVISLLGSVVSAMGLAFYVSANKGIGPVDSVTEMVQRKTAFSYRICKTGFDITLLITGIGIGGVFGIGTIINVLSVGMFMQFFIERYQGFFTKIAEKMQ